MESVLHSDINSNDPDETKKRHKEQEDHRFALKMERELRLVDKRVSVLQEKLGNTLSMHQGSFSKYFE